MKVLVTGGAGYIGSHTCVKLIESGFGVVVVDNFSNSKPEGLRRVEAIVGKSITCYENDVTDRAALRHIFSQEKDIVAVIHFAGLKAVGESWDIPLQYYHVNVEGSVAVAEVMQEFGVDVLVFSSSATVYGDPISVPIREDFGTAPANPYGRSKLMVEEILTDVCHRPSNAMKVALLRYFNPVGAHQSGTIGEDPAGIPNNLLPYVSQVAVGKLPSLHVFGDDYPTPDGTGVRDYIHVLDLAQGHVQAIRCLLSKSPGVHIWNLGTGRGYSVLEMVAAFEKASNRKVPYEVVGRREGDIAECYADPQKAKVDLDWVPEFGIDEMVSDAWRWQSANPNGYDD